MSECRNLENVGQVEELLLMTEQMQDELDQKDQTIQELNRQLSESLTLNEKLNSENRAENIEAFRDCVLADCRYCHGNFIRNNRVADNRDWLSGRKNLPEILLGYHQYRGSDNEYSCCNLLWRMD